MSLNNEFGSLEIKIGEEKPKAVECELFTVASDLSKILELPLRDVLNAAHDQALNIAYEMASDGMLDIETALEDAYEMVLDKFKEFKEESQESEDVRFWAKGITGATLIVSLGLSGAKFLGSEIEGAFALAVSAIFPAYFSYSAGKDCNKIKDRILEASQRFRDKKGKLLDFFELQLNAPENQKPESPNPQYS
ncbi:MAG: hypothetical protein OEY94_02420 [Alphaproteobacteria bacterium]|nr:hypothetical protein [Alphaproteobacteria bacterium]